MAKVSKSKTVKKEISSYLYRTEFYSHGSLEIDVSSNEEKHHQATGMGSNAAVSETLPNRETFLSYHSDFSPAIFCHSFEVETAGEYLGIHGKRILRSCSATQCGKVLFRASKSEKASKNHSRKRNCG